MDPPSLGRLGGRQPWSWGNDAPPTSPSHGALGGALSCDADDAAGPNSPYPAPAPALRCSLLSDGQDDDAPVDNTPTAKEVGQPSLAGSDMDELDSVGREEVIAKPRFISVGHEVKPQREALAHSLAAPPPSTQAERLPSPLQNFPPTSMTPQAMTPPVMTPPHAITPPTQPRHYAQMGNSSSWSATPPRGRFAGGAGSPQRNSFSGRTTTSDEKRLSSRSETVRGDVSLCVRLRPGGNEAASTCSVEGSSCVRLRPPLTNPLRPDPTEGAYRCDMAFGPDASQECVYSNAVTPICDAVMRGYNGAVIAYGQTGSGKTHTMLGDARQGSQGQGVAPRAVSAIFAALQRLPQWRVEVSVLEIYNERVRDLLSPNPGVTHVDIHEIPGPTQAASGVFRCPDASARPASNPEEALVALQEGMRRRETARTDMNHSSSRSHLIFSMSITQTDREAGATLRSRLHLVDLAGSERLKRSMASDSSFSRSARPGTMSPRSPRMQQREACEINKSLSQLALVIQRLTTTGSGQYIPYRDSMLTRLLAESFGGSSKTCLIITCSPMPEDREETKSSLDFGRRAKLVKNKAEINLEVQYEPSMVFRAMIARETEELHKQLLAERNVAEERRAEAERMLQDMQEAASACHAAAEQQSAEMGRLQRDHADAQRTCEEQAIEISKLQAECDTLQERCNTQSAHIEETAAQHQATVDDYSATVGDLEREVAEARRKCEAQVVETARARQRSEELTQILEQKAEDNSRLEAHNDALRKKLEDMTRRGRELDALNAKLEAEKISVHQQWHEAVASAWRLMQDKAPQIMHSHAPSPKAVSPPYEDVVEVDKSSPRTSSARGSQLPVRDPMQDEELLRSQAEPEPHLRHERQRQPSKPFQPHQRQESSPMQSPMFTSSYWGHVNDVEPDPDSGHIVDMIERRAAAGSRGASDRGTDVSSPSAPSVDDVGASRGRHARAWADRHDLREVRASSSESTSETRPVEVMSALTGLSSASVSRRPSTANEGELMSDCKLPSEPGLPPQTALAPAEQASRRSPFWGAALGSFGLPHDADFSQADASSTKGATNAYDLR